MCVVVLYTSHVTPPQDDGETWEAAAAAKLLPLPKSTFPRAGITMPDVLECAMGVLAGIRADPGGGTYQTIKMPAMKKSTMTKNMIHIQPHPPPPSLRMGAVFS
jgi:hypothetical protein